MAKFASIITLLFIVLIIFSAFEEPTMVKGQKSCKRKPKAGRRFCKRDAICQKTCVEIEKAIRGTCDYKFPWTQCFCHFPC
uniref:Knottin scorpion toxin-like domain-containing protein n=1 Tax=Brassica campestris TaxID=3711 RepID=M4E9E0_BRACM